MRHEILVSKISSAQLPIRQLGLFQITSFQSKIDGSLATVISRNSSHTKPLVRIHSQCFTGDVLGSARCDCGLQLQIALQKIAAEGGYLLYLGQEGRGIGLSNKIKSYELQDQGLDTVDANYHLGFSHDQRDYGIAVQILKELNLMQVRLMTNNPLKIKALQNYGIEVERIPIETIPTAENIQYLKTKNDKLGHLISNIG